jgi:hypothetical protein
LRRLMSVLMMTVCVLAGCNNEISQGDKRLKHEYLYKMKSQLTQIIDVSSRLRKYEAVKGYEKNIAFNKKEVNETRPLEGWSDGEVFRERFIKIIDDDIRLMDSISKLDTATIRFDSSEVIFTIRNRQDSLMESLDSLISKVDKE